MSTMPRLFACAFLLLCGLALYESADATTWKRQPGTLLKEPGAGADDGVKGGHATVVVNRDRPVRPGWTPPED